MNNQKTATEEPRKLARITAEQETLLRAFERVKEMSYGEFVLIVRAGRLERFEVRKTRSLVDMKSNTEALAAVHEDLKEMEDLEGVVAI